MPINRDQFDEALDNTEMKIIQFLAEHPKQAFQTGEIERGLGYSRSLGADLGTQLLESLNTLAFVSTLDELAKKRKIAKKAIGGVTYYAASR